jgi:hypothetical protein
MDVSILEDDKRRNIRCGKAVRMFISHCSLEKNTVWRKMF